MSTLIARGLLVVVGLLCAGRAPAAPIQYTIEGVVNGGTWTTTGHPALGVFALGTPSSLSFEIDSETPETPAGASDPDLGSYPIGEPGSFSAGLLVVGAFPGPILPLAMLSEGALGIASAPVMTVRNNGPLTNFDTLAIGAQMVEGFICDPPGPTCPDGPVIHNLGLQFGQSNGGWFDSNAIPTQLSLPQDHFVPRTWFLQSSSGEGLLSFTPTSLSAVPEAGALALLALGGLLAARARSRRC